MTDFAQTSFGWQRQQLQQRFGEWLEFLLQGDPAEPNAPPPPVPLDWLLSPFWERAARVLTWSLAIAIALWLAWQLWCWLQPYTIGKRPGGKRIASRAAAPPRRRSPSGWLATAQTYQRQGNYRRACLCLYAGALQQLNDAGVAPHLDSRTDGEYAHVIAALPNAVPYQTLLRNHEDLRFGGAEATAERFAECREAYQQL
ncbi:MAG: DUF4129 domain-containing protein [Spirulinaceae cyanobacterium SM2_1_0]|nr:DUF4129 domain-containing protein [Spirulinaceae cyanobacterium SM2_1_0]